MMDAGLTVELLAADPADPAVARTLDHAPGQAADPAHAPEPRKAS